MQASKEEIARLREEERQKFNRGEWAKEIYSQESQPDEPKEGVGDGWELENSQNSGNQKSPEDMEVPLHQTVTPTSVGSILSSINSSSVANTSSAIFSGTSGATASTLASSSVLSSTQPAAQQDEEILSLSLPSSFSQSWSQNLSQPDQQSKGKS